MSSFAEKLKDQIRVVVDDKISTFLDKLALEFKLPKDALIEIWNADTEQHAQLEQTIDAECLSSVMQKREKLAQHLATFNKTELIENCRSRKLKSGGSKMELIDRIIDADMPMPANSKVSGQQLSPKKTVVVGKVQDPLQTAVVRNLIKPHIPVIEVKKNRFNNIEHLETNLVFEASMQKIIGRQNHQTGELMSLSPADIDICRKYKFQYVIPENLDASAAANDEDDDDVVDATDDASSSILQNPASALPQEPQEEEEDVDDGDDQDDEDEDDENGNGNEDDDDEEEEYAYNFD